MKPALRIAGWVLLTGVLLFLAFNKHSRSGMYNYHSEVWADKAGYYVYLPATFIYDFDANRFPDSVDVRTGNGFSLNHPSGLVYTKYTSGVALMQAPFWLVAHALAPVMGEPRDGFGRVYQKSVNVAAVIYLVLGLLLLSRVLRRRFGAWPAFFALFALLAGTNLYFYSIDETGMSHVYSFFLFAAFLYLLERSNYLRSVTVRQAVMLGLVAGLIALIRPVNVLVFAVYFFAVSGEAWQQPGSVVGLARERIATLRTLPLRTWLLLLVSALLVWLPQMGYWYATAGSLLHYSYEGEGFNWFDPHLLHLWFAPRNGLFLYSPMVLLMLIAAFVMARRGPSEGGFLLVLFAVLSYVLSCWWDWGFGCAFGSRSFVEFYALFALPLAWLFGRSVKWHIGGRVLLAVVVVALIGLNLKLTYTFDKCYFGEGNWDWKYFWQLVSSPAK